ncbi:MULTISPECIES: sulfotransferase domain-containing protein [Limibacillus]|jgi:hypothetical protein|uniref:Sulfotransferase domain-containing protein n=1 Tax=Limibacillus halophilus TaxID=1579333 RepID=A0A839SPR1_9PROT|nr:sulfotransferase domain-containing protein [Limibacillus halophilus]MBB3063919.1 hypothetical protein [Limibacillus halophilus]
MGRIIWLASYPKSGNTWLRAFLANLVLDRKEPLPINDLKAFTLSDTRPRFYAAASGQALEALDLNDAEVVALRPKVQEMIAAERPHDHFVKTHSIYGKVGGHPLFAPTLSAGVVYVARNPLDVIPSYAAHFNLSLDQAILALESRENCSPTAGASIGYVMGRWCDHVESWMSNKQIPCIVLRYEDLATRPLQVFGHLAKTLGIAGDPERLQRAIDFSSFKELSRQERESDFSERPPHADRFFRSGKVGAGADLLSAAQRDRVIKVQGPMMRRLGYLDDAGKLTKQVTA